MADDIRFDSAAKTSSFTSQRSARSQRRSPFQQWSHDVTEITQLLAPEIERVTVEPNDNVRRVCITIRLRDGSQRQTELRFEQPVLTLGMTTIFAALVFHVTATIRGRDFISSYLRASQDSDEQAS